MAGNLRVRPFPGLVVGGAGVVMIAVPLWFVHRHLSLATPALLLVLPVLAAALVGGRRPAVIVAVGAAFAFSFTFIAPVHTLYIARAQDSVAYLVFVAVALVVGTLAAAEARRRQWAEERTAELAALNAELLRVAAEREELMAEAQKVAVLEQVDRQRSALLRSVSHDLRTPLTTIRAVSSDLRSEDVYASETRNELLDLVIDEAERLDRLVGNLLNLSRVEAGALRPDLHDYELADIVDEARLRHQRLFASSAVRVRLPDGLPSVLVDPAQLDQVFANLLENAVRHGGPGTHVEISACAHASLVEVVVTDDGPGLADEVRGRTFEPWVTTASSGIGLTICKAIVEAHGGTICAGDNSPRGARFSFTLPCGHARH
jgi:two-component system sensor histidine kinase KdpD